MPDQLQALADLWEWFAQRQCRGYSPLYERISMAVASDTEVLEFVRAAPPAAHMPLALLAAVHYLLLDGYEHPLADVYAGRSDADPVPLFLDVCRTRRDDLAALLAVRRIQTNDCGRSAVIAPGLTWLAGQVPGPLALVDVGASAGLNLLCDRYRIDYGDHGATGPADSPVEISCRIVAGLPPIAEQLPPLVSRVGIDRSPVDLSHADDARWLLACVWPDTGRIERTAASIRLAQADLPLVLAGDANDVLPTVLADLPGTTTAVVVTTWAFAYFSIEQRQEFVGLLDTASSRRPVAWLSAEGAGTVDGFAEESLPEHDDTESNLLGAVILDHGRRRQQLLGFVHQHGGWIDWRDTPV
jgi:hypothetical protein